MRERQDRRKEPGEHWTKMIRRTMEEPAWRALSTTAQALYPWLKFEWRGPDANNNGQIRLSVRQAADRLGVSRATAARAFHELQAKGFLVMTEFACLGVDGAAKSPAFALTELKERLAEKRQDGRKLYRDWKPGRDFPVHRAETNNPRGINGKTKSCPKNDDGTVLEFRTKGKKPSQI
ncbi:MAG: helix-turn-helix domain-containing protein [Mesorhizobium sp.]|nr:MAG: helix-turn-helix domain-containing protein [Mesorhizobium sp.]